MAITVHNSGVTTSATLITGAQSAASASPAIRISAAAETFLLFAIGYRSNTSAVSSVAWQPAASTTGQQAMTFLGKTVHASSTLTIEYWGLLAPSAHITTTAKVVATVPVGLNGIAFESWGVCFTGVDQTTPYAGYPGQATALSTNQGTSSANPTIPTTLANVATVVGQVVVQGSAWAIVDGTETFIPTAAHEWIGGRTNGTTLHVAMQITTATSSSTASNISLSNNINNRSENWVLQAFLLNPSTTTAPRMITPPTVATRQVSTVSPLGVTDISLAGNVFNVGNGTTIIPSLMYGAFAQGNASSSAPPRYTAVATGASSTITYSLAVAGVGLGARVQELGGFGDNTTAVATRLFVLPSIAAVDDIALVTVRTQAASITSVVTAAATAWTSVTSRTQTAGTGAAFFTQMFYKRIVAADIVNEASRTSTITPDASAITQCTVQLYRGCVGAGTGHPGTSPIDASAVTGGASLAANTTAIAAVLTPTGPNRTVVNVFATNVPNSLAREAMGDSGWTRRGSYFGLHWGDNANLSAHSDLIKELTPLGYWRLGESTGATVIADATANGNTGTGIGTLTSVAGTISGDANTALSFDGTASTISIPGPVSVAAGDVWTFYGWIKKAVNGTVMTIYDYGSAGSGNNGGFVVRLDATGALQVVRVPSDVILATATITLTDALWHQIVVTKSGATLKYYIDGVNRTGVVTNFATAATGAVSFIGKSAVPFHGGFWNGSQDEVAFFNYAISQTTVTTLYNLGSAGTRGIIPAQFVPVSLTDWTALTVALIPASSATGIIRSVSYTGTSSVAESRAGSFYKRSDLLPLATTVSPSRQGAFLRTVAAAGVPLVALSRSKAARKTIAVVSITTAALSRARSRYLRTSTVTGAATVALSRARSRYKRTVAVAGTTVTSNILWQAIRFRTVAVSRTTVVAVSRAGSRWKRTVANNSFTTTILHGIKAGGTVFVFRTLTVASSMTATMTRVSRTFRTLAVVSTMTSSIGRVSLTNRTLAVVRATTVALSRSRATRRTVAMTRFTTVAVSRSMHWVRTVALARTTTVALHRLMSFRRTILQSRTATVTLSRNLRGHRTVVQIGTTTVVVHQVVIGGSVAFFIFGGDPTPVSSNSATWAPDAWLYDSTKFTTATFYFEATLKSASPTIAALARLYDMNSLQEVPGSRITTVSPHSTQQRIRSAGFTGITTGHLFRAEIGKNGTNASTMWSAKLIVEVP